jgi:hypothetical protein
MITNDFSIAYGQMSDDQLLAVASARESLTPEAILVLDSELSRRNLTEFDRIKYEKFVKNAKRRESHD